MPRRLKTWLRSSKSKKVGKNKGAWLLAIYFFLSVYLLPMFPHGGSANELTRWATAASLVEKGSFEISWTEPLIGPNVDTAKVGDRVYSNKAPGTAILAAPIYAIVRLFVGSPDASNIRISWFAMRFVLSTLPLLLLGVWLYARKVDEFALATLLFATPLFLYSLLLFSHVFVAVLLYFAFRFLYDQRYIMPWHCLLSGALCGLAVISEFTAIFPVAAFAAGLLFTDKRERYRRVVFFVLGGLPFAAFLAAYNYSLFGSPFSMSYAHESFPEWAEVANQGVFGIGFPTLSNAYLLLFSPSRGLIFTAPVLILSIVAFFTTRDSKLLRERVKIAAIILTILVMCGHGAAHGGWAFGPRYLVIIIPLLLDSFFDDEIYDKSNLWQGFLFGLSIVLCVLPALTFSFAPPEFPFPHNDFWMRLLIDEKWVVPNFANVAGFSSTIWTLLPVFAALLAVILFVVQGMRRPKRFLMGLGVALVFACIYLFMPLSENNDELAIRRASIAERFYKPAGRLETFKQRSVAAGDYDGLRNIRQTEWLIADTRSYAPDDFPYLPATALSPSPTAMLKAAIAAQTSGDVGSAEKILREGKEKFLFARCDYSTNLAVILYTTGRRDEALQELESIQPLVGKASSPVCMKSQFLLGTLYQEIGRSQDASKAFNTFLINSERSDDAEIKGLRRQLSGK